MIVKFKSNDVELRFGYVEHYCFNEENGTLCICCKNDSCGIADRHIFGNVTDLEILEEGDE